MAVSKVRHGDNNELNMCIISGSCTERPVKAEESDMESQEHSAYHLLCLVQNPDQTGLTMCVCVCVYNKAALDLKCTTVITFF